MEKKILPRLALVGLIIYSLNTIYFSLNNFLFTSIYHHNRKESTFVVIPQYASLIGKYSFLSEFFSFFKLNSAYSFFGEGLSSTVEIDYSFYDNTGGLLKTTSFQQAFSSDPGKTRASTLTTRIFFAIIAQINRDKLSLRNKGLSTQEVTYLKHDLSNEDRLLDIFLKRTGLYCSKRINDWGSFEASVYLLNPSQISTASGDVGRSVYLYRKVRYVNSTNKLIRQK